VRLMCYERGKDPKCGTSHRTVSARCRHPRLTRVSVLEKTVSNYLHLRGEDMVSLFFACGHESRCRLQSMELAITSTVQVR
jgi:hypothetical protein